MRKTVLLALLFMALGGQAWGANCGGSPSTYYISSSIGSDSNNGTSTTTPWAHHPWDSNKTGNASCSLQAGDTVIMRQGDVWYNDYMTAAQGGSAGLPITTTSNNTFYALGLQGVYPKLSGALNPASLSWAQDGINPDYYVTGANPVPTQPIVVMFNNMELNAVATKLLVESTPNSFWWDSVNQTVYVYILGGVNPSTGTCEVANKNYVFLNSATGYQTLSYLWVSSANTNAGGVIFNNGFNNVILDHLIVQGFNKIGIYQYNGTGDQTTNCTVSQGTVNAVTGIYSFLTPGAIVTGNTVNYATTTVGNYAVYLSATSGTVSNNTVYNNGSGLEVSGATGGFTVANNLVYNNNGGGITVTGSNNGTINNNTVYGNTSVSSSSALLLSGTSGSTIYSNNIHDNSTGYYNTGWGVGITISGSSASNLIYNNTLLRNYIGIEIAPSSGVDGNYVYYNLVANSTVNGIDDEGSGSGYDYILNNTVIHNPSANNSTPYTGHGIDCQLSCKEIVFANNIVYIMQSGTNNQGIAVAGSFTHVKLNNNLYFDATVGKVGDIAQLSGVMYTTLGAWQAAIQANSAFSGLDSIQSHADNQSLSSDPLFTNIPGGIYTLQRTSSASYTGNIGVLLGIINIVSLDGYVITDANGIAKAIPSIGAYESAQGIIYGTVYGTIY